MQRRDPRERAHLRVRKPPVRKRRRDRGQARAALAPCAPSRAPPTATARSATRATRRSSRSPTSRTRSDRRSRARAEHPIRLGVHMPREPADFQIEVVDRAVGGSSDACRAASELGGHRRPPRRRKEQLILYTASRAFRQLFQSVTGSFRSCRGGIDISGRKKHASGLRHGALEGYVLWFLRSSGRFDLR